MVKIAKKEVSDMTYTKPELVTVQLMDEETVAGGCWYGSGENDPYC